MEAWLEQTSLSVKRRDGVVIGEVEHLRYYDRDKRLRKFGYDLSCAEIGCFQAHRDIWKECARTERLTVILESDTQPQCLVEFVDVISELPKHEKKFDILRLFGTFPQNEMISRPVACLLRHRIVQPLGDPMGAVGYALTPNAAKRLLRASEVFHEPVDVFLGNTWRHRLRYRALKPYVLELCEFESSIGARSRPAQSVIERLRIEVCRASDDLKRIAYMPWHFFN